MLGWPLVTSTKGSLLAQASKEAMPSGDAFPGGWRDLVETESTMATKHGGPNDGAERSEAGSDEQVSGHGATMIGTPALVGLPQAEEEQFSVRGLDGQVEGPMATDALIGAIRAGRYTGDESVSRDGRFWIPIVAIPDLGAAFRSSEVPSGSTLFGGAPLVFPSDPPTETDASDDALGLLSDDELDALASPTSAATMAMELPAGFALGESAAPVRGGATMNFDMDELPAEASILADLLDLDLTAEAQEVPAPKPADEPVLLDLEDEPLSESLLLPSPKGFTAFSDAPLELMEAVREQQPPQTTELPLPNGFTHLGQADLSVVEALGLEVEDLPISAGLAQEFPRSASEELPRSAGGISNLPTPAAALPRGGATLVAAEEPAGDGASELPANRGAALGSIQTLDGLVGDFGEPLDEPMGVGEFPASARAAGANILDTLSSVDAIWAGAADAKSAPSAELRGGGARTVAAARAATVFGASTVPSGAHFDDFDAPDAGDAHTAGATPYLSGFDQPAGLEGFDSYQPADGGSEADPWGLPAEGSEAGGEQAATDEYGEYFGTGAGQSTSARKVARPSSNKKPWLAIAMGLLVVGGGGYYGFTVYQQKQAEAAARQAAIEAAQNRVVEQPKIVLGQLSELESGSSKAYQSFVDSGRKLLARGGSDEERARVMIAAALLLAEQPEQRDLFADLEKWNGQLKSADAPLTRLARGAYLAMRRDETAKATLEGVSDPNLRAFASLFQAIGALQIYRGIDLTIPLTPPKAAKGAKATAAKAKTGAEGSGATDGSGKAAAAPKAEEPAKADAAAPAGKGAPAAAAAVVVAAPAEAEVSRELPKGTIEALERAATLDPKFVAPHYWLGWIALSEKDPARAQLAFGRALALNPQHVRSVVGMADAQLREAKLVDAETRVTRAIEDLAATMTQSERCETYLLAASIAVARMQPPLAIENLLSALQADPRNRRATRELGEQFFRAGEFDRAIEHFKQNAALSAGDPESTLGLIKAQFGKKDWTALLKVLPPAIAQYPRDGRFLYWFGRVNEEAVEFDKAKGQYETAIQADPNYLRPYIRLAELDFRSNDLPSARKRLDEALGVGSTSSELANEVGETFLAMGETNRAVAAFRAALAIDRSNPDARINLAGHFIKTRQFSEALEELNEMIAAGVASPKVKLRQASAMIGVGEADRAIETLLKLLEAEPKNAAYLFELGRAHMENKSWQSARENFARAYEQAPTMDSALYQVGRCELELGHLNEAISALTRVSQRNPSGEYHYWLGRAMERVPGDQAMAEYTQAIELDAAWSLENPEVFFQRASIYQSRKQNNLAKLDLGVVLALQPNHAPASWLLGRVLYDERDFMGAIDRLDHAIAVDPKQSDAHYYAALCYLALPIPENGKALGHLQQAVAGGLADSNPRVLEKMAYAKAQAGDTAGAAGDLQRYLDKVPTLPKEQQRSYKNQIDRWRSNR